MCHPSWSMEDRGAESNVDYDGLAQEASQEKNITNQPRDCSHILENNVAAFWFCLKHNLSEAKSKKFRLMAVVVEISKQSSIDCYMVVSGHLYAAL